MTENEEREQLTDSGHSVNRISELPGKPFRVTMEVPLFLTMLGISLSGAALSNILLYRTCVHTLHHDEEVCRAFLSPNHTDTTKELEEEVQRYVTLVSTVKLVMESVIPAFLSFFLGVWSDTYGRKPLVVWPVLGLSLSAIMIVVYAMLENLGPWWYLLTAVPFSLTGGYTVIFTGAFCYINDITSTNDRSLRMTILDASVSMGSVIGSIASSYVLKAIGNVYLLLIVATVNVMAYAFTTVCIQESLRGAIQGGFTSVLDYLLVKEMMRECFKRRPNYGRAQIILLTVSNCLSIFILYGTFSLDYMYTREKLQWSMKDYTIFSAVSTTISFVGSFVGIGLFLVVFGVSDLVLIIVAFLSATVQYLIRAFATVSWHMYLGAGISSLKGLTAPLIRSFLTKTLPLEDIAKVFSLISAIEGICPLIAPPAYSSLYAFTISSFPGAIYVLSAVITGSCVVMSGIIPYYVMPDIYYFLLHTRISYIKLLSDQVYKGGLITRSDLFNNKEEIICKIKY